MSELWQGVIGGFASLLTSLHDITEPLFGVFAWGWAIILLTLLVRIVLLPLAIKQTTSMRAMQGLQPEVKRIQAKYKVDRGLIRSDPDKYKEQRAKQQEEMQALYKERGVNPAAGCLPLVAQMPVFFALFSVLNGEGRYVPALQEAGFYFINALSLGAPQGAGWGAYVLIAIMGLTTFFSQRQMMKSNPAVADQPQQKIMLYAMPVMLTVFGINFPAGVLLYWVTTNLWTMGQQYVMFRKLGPSSVPAGAPATAASLTNGKSRKPAQQAAALEANGKAKDPTAPKGAPTPKRADARKGKAPGPQGSGTGRGGNGRESKGRGSSAASAKQKPR